VTVYDLFSWPSSTSVLPIISPISLVSIKLILAFPEGINKSLASFISCACVVDKFCIKKLGLIKVYGILDAIIALSIL